MSFKTLFEFYKNPESKRLYDSGVRKYMLRSKVVDKKKLADTGDNRVKSLVKSIQQQNPNKKLTKKRLKEGLRKMAKENPNSLKGVLTDKRIKKLQKPERSGWMTAALVVGGDPKAVSKRTLKKPRRKSRKQSRKRLRKKSKN